MSEWKEVTLSDITIRIGDGLHGTPQYDNLGDYYFINGNNLSQGKIVIKPDTKRVNEKEYKKHEKQLSDKTILLSINGTIGNLALYNGEKCVLGKSACYITVNHKSDRKFLYYVFCNREFQSFINENATGTTIPNMPLKRLREYAFNAPLIPEQKAIAFVLSSLDDKIDLLHRQNQTLEAMAETLFRQWFVEDVKEDWEVVQLGDYVDCINGVSYKGDDLQPSEIALVTLKNFDREGGFRLDGYKQFVGKFKAHHVVTQGELVVAHTDITQDAAVVGNPVLVVAEPAFRTLVISMDLVKVISKHAWLQKEFLYSLMRAREFKEHCRGHANGSTVLHLSKSAIPSFEFALPPKEKIAAFTTIAKDLFKKKFENISQCRILEKLRDDLLPKLMSGEVRVDY